MFGSPRFAKRLGCASCFMSVVVGLQVPANGADPSLPRRPGPLGVRIEALPDEGVRIVEVLPGSPAAAAGLGAGVTIVAIDGTATPTPAALVEALRSVKAGTRVRVDTRRAGVPGDPVTIVLPAAAEEQVPGSRVVYDSVTLAAGNRLRTIVTVPIDSPRATAGRSPAVLYVQGIPCQSIDRQAEPVAADTRIVHALATAGFVTMRVEKSGLGDSEGPPCSEIDFETELEGYKAALRQLAGLPSVDPERVFVFGHSMGGVMAPFLTTVVPVRGTMVYGTLARTWFEYQLENVRRQMRLQPEVTESMVSEAVQAEARSSAMVLIDKKTLGDVWARWPELRQPTQGTLFDETHQSTRHMSFFHQLQELNLARAWEESRGAVLAIWGEYDWVTTREDHDLIAAIVNRRSPGAGSVLTMPDADHAFTTHASLEASVAELGMGEWDENLPRRIIAWMEAVERGEATPSTPGAATAVPPASGWRKMPTEPYAGKQDDVFFVSATTGWYGNGAGRVYRTDDGGARWAKVWDRPGTFVRCLAFLDEHVGVLGNVGPGAFPGVTDAVPIYRTIDGGTTWTPVTDVPGSAVAGLCALDIVSVPSVDAGKPGRRPRIVGVGRVGGPAALVWSDDRGVSWKQGTLPAEAAMAFDVRFLDERRGFIAAATDVDVARSHALGAGGPRTVVVADRDVHAARRAARDHGGTHDSRPRASTGKGVRMPSSCHQTTSWRFTQGQT